MRKKASLMGIFVATTLVIAYAQPQSTPSVTPVAATAELKDAQGNIVGQAILTDAGAVKVQVTLNGFKAAKSGEHGIHIHAVGNCSPTFAAAGGHFNPNAKKHGFIGKDGHHAGDLPNLTVDADGNAKYEVVTELVSLRDGPINLFDQDGTAIVIHAGPDDYRTDPAGGSGDRIACGVLTPQK